MIPFFQNSIAYEKNAFLTPNFFFIASVQDGCGFLFYQSCHNIHFCFSPSRTEGLLFSPVVVSLLTQQIQSTGGTCSHNSRRQRPWLNLVDSPLLIFFSHSVFISPQNLFFSVLARKVVRSYSETLGLILVLRIMVFHSLWETRKSVKRKCEFV